MPTGANIEVNVFQYKLASLSALMAIALVLLLATLCIKKDFSGSIAVTSPELLVIINVHKKF